MMFASNRQFPVYPDVAQISVTNPAPAYPGPSRDSRRTATVAAAARATVRYWPCDTRSQWPCAPAADPFPVDPE
jgi:hypothetical protein